MVSMSIKIKSKDLVELTQKYSGSGFISAALPNTLDAFNSTIDYAENIWKGFLMGTNDLSGIPPLENVTKDMIKSINHKYNDDPNGLSATVYSTSKKLEEVCRGTPDVEFDMKKTHPYGRKSRVSSKGIPYLIIPFRWGTPNGKDTKRAHFNNFIKQKQYTTNVLPMDKSLVLKRDENNLRFEKNFKGELIERARYSWESRLSEDVAESFESVNGKSYSNAGLVRMKDFNKSTYFTFRIISANSPEGSWMYKRKGKPGIDMIGALDRMVRPEFEKRLREGFNKDIQALKL